MTPDQHPLIYPLKPEERRVRVTVIDLGVHSEGVLKWRRTRFTEMGFVDYLAEFLADTRIDLYVMHDLLKKGCPHDLAMDILMGTTAGGAEDHQWDWTT